MANRRTGMGACLSSLEAGGQPEGTTMSQDACPFSSPVDAVALEARARAFAARSLRNEAEQKALTWIVRMIDLTTLEGQDTPGRVAALCRQARTPLPRFPEVPPVAAVCVYPSLVSVARDALAGSPVRVASVATAFPSGQSFWEVRLDEVRRALEDGAHEIDMVINRGAFLAGDFERVRHEIAAVKEACGPAHLKVILETGELGGVRPGAPGLRAGHGGRRGFHQDVHG